MLHSNIANEQCNVDENLFVSVLKENIDFTESQP